MICRKMKQNAYRLLLCVLSSWDATRRGAETTQNTMTLDYEAFSSFQSDAFQMSRDSKNIRIKEEEAAVQHQTTLITKACLRSGEGRRLPVTSSGIQNHAGNPLYCAWGTSTFQRLAVHLHSIWAMEKAGQKGGIHEIQVPRPLPRLSPIDPAYCNPFLSVFPTRMLTPEQKQEGED